ncbi:hypothetical protein B296_00037761 [Ensete ventricosum]|uniref:Uncharacterized protein n=1 Tax=Ensete ventricosum TaxID=4639 RepID=A0A426ZW27_ENSVE|nr:hypothetical protein B296_00037761 [Ensete ventricosum]
MGYLMPWPRCQHDLVQSECARPPTLLRAHQRRIAADPVAGSSGTPSEMWRTIVLYSQNDCPFRPADHVLHKRLSHSTTWPACTGSTQLGLELREVGGGDWICNVVAPGVVGSAVIEVVVRTDTSGLTGRDDVVAHVVLKLPGRPPTWTSGRRGRARLTSPIFALSFSPTPQGKAPRRRSKRGSGEGFYRCGSSVLPGVGVGWLNWSQIGAKPV